MPSKTGKRRAKTPPPRKTVKVQPKRKGRSASPISKSTRERLTYMEFPPEDINEMLIEATIANDIDLVTELIEDGADVNYREAEALCRSIDNGHYEIMIKLLESGADPHYENRGGENALDVAQATDIHYNPNRDTELANLLREYNYPNLFTMVSELYNKYEMAVKMQKKYKRNLRKKKSRKNKRVLHKYMEPSQRRVDSQGRPRFPQYSNLAQVALAQPNITERITKHLPKDWSMRGGKKSRRKPRKNKN